VPVSRHVAHGTSLYLRCGPGLLIRRGHKQRHSVEDEFWYARARTWIADSA
jgi:hypothetical protein